MWSLPLKMEFPLKIYILEVCFLPSVKAIKFNVNESLLPDGLHTVTSVNFITRKLHRLQKNNYSWCLLPALLIFWMAWVAVKPSLHTSPPPGQGCSTPVETTTLCHGCTCWNSWNIPPHHYMNPVSVTLQLITACFHRWNIYRVA